MKSTEKAAVPKEVTDFYMALNEIKGRQTEASFDITITEEQKELSVEQKVPLLNFIDFMPDRDEINGIFEKVCDIILAHRPQLKVELDKIKADLDVENRDIRPLLEQFIWQNEMYIGGYPGDRGINSEIFSLVLFNVAKSLVKVFAKEIKSQVHYDKWTQNTCPVCGWKASMAVTSGENKQRVLHCSLCDTVWPFKTIACTHCSNDDHRTLKYITVEDDELYKINVCEKCRGYIKVLDENKLAVKSSIAEEDVRSIYLDFIAQREGYCKSAYPTDNEIN